MQFALNKKQILSKDIMQSKFVQQRMSSDLR